MSEKSLADQSHSSILELECAKSKSSIRKVGRQESEEYLANGPYLSAISRLSSSASEDEMKSDSSVEPHHNAPSRRDYILQELVETERSYVDALKILVKKYMGPLKLCNFMDTNLVDEIFFQIPEILFYHEMFLAELTQRCYDEDECIGDICLETKESLLECYKLFVNNWKTAKGSLKMAVASKPQLVCFLENNYYEHKRLSIDSLLIMPIQRIPRYELLINELLLRTDPIHTDYLSLKLVQVKLKEFALKINVPCISQNDNREVEIEGWTAGLGHLIRYDVVVICSPANIRKERALILFADSLVIASIKHKSTRKKSFLAYPNDESTIERCKLKLLIKILLADIFVLNNEHDYCPTGHEVGSHGGSHIDDLKDLKAINKMMDIASLIKCPHLELDFVLEELYLGLKHHCDNSANAVELEFKCKEGSGNTPERLKILFGDNATKNAWLQSFQLTIGKFVRFGFGRVPQMKFLQSVTIKKTQLGLTLSCAAAISLHNKLSKSVEMSDVWVAISGGANAQISILKLDPEPTISDCKVVAGSRITCIIAVPPSSAHFSLGICLSHPHSDDTATTSFQHHHQHQYHSLGPESEECEHKNRNGLKITSEQWSVWLGTEEGALQVYDGSDSTRLKKDKMVIQHKASLKCMVYFDSRVFVAIGNGDIAIYYRDNNLKAWQVNEPSWMKIGSSMNPVTRIQTISSSIWCVCGSQIKVYGEIKESLHLLKEIETAEDHFTKLTREVSILAATEENVWIAIHASSILKCYNNNTYECFFKIDVAIEVTKFFGGCKERDRRHRGESLHITALLVAPDQTLWIGTSTGIILILDNSESNYKITPLAHGHNGEVRFLTFCTTRDSCAIISGGDGYQEFRLLIPIGVHENIALASEFIHSEDCLTNHSDVGALNGQGRDTTLVAFRNGCDARDDLSTLVALIQQAQIRLLTPLIQDL